MDESILFGRDFAIGAIALGAISFFRFSLPSFLRARENPSLIGPFYFWKLAQPLFFIACGLFLILSFEYQQHEVLTLLPYLFLGAFLGQLLMISLIKRNPKGSLKKRGLCIKGALLIGFGLFSVARFKSFYMAELVFVVLFILVGLLLIRDMWEKDVKNHFKIFVVSSLVLIGSSFFLNYHFDFQLSRVLSLVTFLFSLALTLRWSPFFIASVEESLRASFASLDEKEANK